MSSLGGKAKSKM